MLPSQAYLLSLRDQNLPMRRAALEDAEKHFAEFRRRGSHQIHLAVVAVIGEALQVVEDVAALGNAFFSAPPGLAFYVTAASYGTRAVNNFYSSLRNRPLDDLLRLLGMRLGDTWIQDLFAVDPAFTPAERAAIEEAHMATARFVQRQLLGLAEEWARYRRFFHAYKHGLLVANYEDVTVVENRSRDIPGIVVWLRRRPAALATGQIEPPYEDTVEHVGQVGRLALDLLEHFTSSRLRIFDTIEINPDGTWTPRRLRGTPWLWWFGHGEVTETSRNLISQRFGISFD